MDAAEYKHLVLGLTSSRQRVQNDVLGRYQLALPGSEIVPVFPEVMAPIQKSTAANHKDTETLAILRDFLLPRLISGQLQILATPVLATQL